MAFLLSTLRSIALVLGIIWVFVLSGMNQAYAETRVVYYEVTKPIFNDKKLEPLNKILRNVSTISGTVSYSSERVHGELLESVSDLNGTANFTSNIDELFDYYSADIAMFRDGKLSEVYGWNIDTQNGDNIIFGINFENSTAGASISGSGKIVHTVKIEIITIDSKTIGP